MNWLSDEKKHKPNSRFTSFSYFLKMEKDEYNIVAAKALKSLMLGNKKEAARYQKELEDLRNGKKKVEKKGII